MVVLHRSPGMHGWRPLQTYGDPYGWVGDPPSEEPSEAAVEEAVNRVQEKLTQAVAREPGGVTARCFKCRAVQEMLSPVESRNKKGTRYVTGTCPICGGNLFRFGGMK